MSQRFGQLGEFRDKQGRRWRVGADRPNLAHGLRSHDAPPLVTPTRCGAELATIEIGVDISDFRVGLERAWHLMLATRIDRVLTVLEAIERQLDDLPPPISTRYRMATGLLRLAVVAFGDDNLAIPAIVIARVFVEGGADFGILLTDAPSRMEPLEPADHRPLTFMRSRGSGAAQASSSADDAITAREREVLSMISRGHSNKHIARTLKISPETVKSHVKRIFSRLSVSTRTEAVSRALSLGLL